MFQALSDYQLRVVAKALGKIFHRFNELIQLSICWSGIWTADYPPEASEPVLNGVGLIVSRFYRNRNAEELPSTITDATPIHISLLELVPKPFIMYRNLQHTVVRILSDLSNVMVQVAPEFSSGKLGIVADQHAVPFQIVPNTLNHVVCFLF